jgi:hypothetical protein
MITDRNKDIAAITYNHLNLPDQVTKTSGEYVKYVYDAAGAKNEPRGIQCFRCLGQEDGLFG